MANMKVKLSVYKNGEFVGYVAHVSYNNRNYVTTMDSNKAKKYVVNDRLHAEIDYLTQISPLGFLFVYA